MNTPSKLTNNQIKTFGPKPIAGWGRGAFITAEVRYDDQCRNGHNTFSITAEIRRPGASDIEAGGCLHAEVAKHFPELAPLIRWHLVSSDGPMHYSANTLYWLGYHGWCDGKTHSPPNLEHARSTACWPDMPESFLAAKFDPNPASESAYAVSKARVVKALEDRRSALLAEFRVAVESLGFVW